MTIDNFHNSYWFGDALWLNDHMYYNAKSYEKPSYWNEIDEGKFIPCYSMINSSKKFGRIFTPHDIERIFDSIDLSKYAGKKFIIGDYTFYGFQSDVYKDSYENYFIEQAIYMDYHGYRLKALKLTKSKCNENDNYKKKYSKSFEGLEIVFDFLRDNQDVVLMDYELEELTGPIRFMLKPRSEYGLTPSAYLANHHSIRKWEGAVEKIGEIDLDHFIKMDITDGVYKPTKSIITKLLSYDNKPLLKNKTKQLKDLGVKTIKFLNNSNWNLSEYYDLIDVEIKASKSVLEKYPNMRKFSKDEKALLEIETKEKIEEENLRREILNDTYSLTQNGKTILDNVRSYEISNYFENKVNKDFELFVIETGKQCFEVAPELKKIFFGKFGIYSYTELAGKTFADFEDIERINNLKNITLPKRLITLINGGKIEIPSIDEYNNNFEFKKGATYLGAAKDENGNVIMITESGDQGI